MPQLPIYDLFCVTDSCGVTLKVGKGWLIGAESVTLDTLIAKWQAFNILSNELYTLQTEMRLDCLKKEGILLRSRSRRSTAVSTKVVKAHNSYQRYSEILRDTQGYDIHIR